MFSAITTVLPSVVCLKCCRSVDWRQGRSSFLPMAPFSSQAKIMDNISFTSCRNRRFDVGVMFVTDHLNVFVSKAVNVLDVRVQFERSVGFSGSLLIWRRAWSR